jgi:hypothetical protein
VLKCYLAKIEIAGHLVNDLVTDSTKSGSKKLLKHYLFAATPIPTPDQFQHCHETMWERPSDYAAYIDNQKRQQKKDELPQSIIIIQ